MRKKILHILFIFFVLMISTSYVFPFQDLYVPKKTHDFSFKIRGASFYPSGSSFRNLYNNGWQGGGEFAFRIFNFMDVWIAGDLYSDSAKLPFSQEESRMTITGIGGGLNFGLQFGVFHPYLGFGPWMHFYKETNPIGTANGSKLGYKGQAGVQITLFKMFLVDFFAAYTKCKVRPQQITSELGGLSGGLGIGISF